MLTWSGSLTPAPFLLYAVGLDFYSALRIVYYEILYTASHQLAVLRIFTLL